MFEMVCFFAILLLTNETSEWVKLLFCMQLVRGTALLDFRPHLYLY